MNYCVFIFLIAMAAVTSAALEIYPRGCIYIEGRCYKGCPVGTHSYDTGCGPLTPEPTCDEPHPVQEEGSVCDYSACHCDEPTVRDKATEKCIPLDQCPKKE